MLNPRKYIKKTYAEFWIMNIKQMCNYLAIGDFTNEIIHL